MKKIDTQILETFNSLIDYTNQLKVTNPLDPLETCKNIWKTVADIQLWQNKGATLVGVKRDGQPRSLSYFYGR